MINKCMTHVTTEKKPSFSYADYVPTLMPCVYTSLYFLTSGLTNDYFYLFTTAFHQKEFEAACKID